MVYGETLSIGGIGHPGRSTEKHVFAQTAFDYSELVQVGLWRQGYRLKHADRDNTAIEARECVCGGGSSILSGL